MPNGHCCLEVSYRLRFAHGHVQAGPVAEHRPGHGLPTGVPDRAKDRLVSVLLCEVGGTYVAEGGGLNA